MRLLLVGNKMGSCDLIIPGLYLGNYEAACNKRLLDSLGITHILTVADGLSPEFPDDFRYLIIPVYDSFDEDLFTRFETTCDFISKSLESGKVLVHCYMGISRSSTVVIAYLIKSKSMKFSEAFEYTAFQHPETYPNANFVNQLKRFESVIVIFM